MTPGQLGADLTGNPATPATGKEMLLALILGAVQAVKSSISNALGNGVGTYVAIHVGNGGSGTIPTTAKRWAINFVGTGTANTFLDNTAVTGGQGFADNASPSAAIPIVCDGSTVVDGFYSTT